ncbi:unnamed protein product [Rangifer tarandus platyrhynchus]|uniref:Uncharacterized protein n=1 Tax=Rangifer tarandus platyrhynchus TaxID=3082113 RepID=A0ABN9A1Q5_RANTA|nr:unnamed protein product [Rangifer tarandus platyrhynchus]
MASVDTRAVGGAARPRRALQMFLSDSADLSASVGPIRRFQAEEDSLQAVITGRCVENRPELGSGAGRGPLTVRTSNDCVLDGTSWRELCRGPPAAATEKALETHIPVPEASRKPGAVKEWIVWAYQKPAARGTGKAGPRLVCSPVDLPAGPLLCAPPHRRADYVPHPPPWRGLGEDLGSAPSPPASARQPAGAPGSTLPTDPAPASGSPLQSGRAGPGECSSLPPRPCACHAAHAHPAASIGIVLKFVSRVGSRFGALCGRALGTTSLDPSGVEHWPLPCVRAAHARHGARSLHRLLQAGLGRLQRNQLCVLMTD